MSFCGVKRLFRIPNNTLHQQFLTQLLVMRDVGIVIAARVLQVATAFVALRVMTSQLTTIEVGKTAIILSIAMFFTLIFISPVGNYINRQINTWYSSGLIRSRFILAGAYLVSISVTSAIVVALCYEWYGSGWGLSLLWLATLVSGLIFLKTLNMSMVTSLNLLGRRIPWAVLTVLTLWLGLSASWVLTLYYPKAEYWLLGQLLGFSFAGALAIALVLRKSDVQPKNNIGAESNHFLLMSVLAFCLPLALSTGLNWVQFQSYRLVIGEMVSLSYLGLFAAGYAVSAGIVGAFETTVQQYFYPKFYKGLDATTENNVADSWLSYASVVLPFTILTGMMVAMLASPLTHILVDSSFWDASSFVVMGALVEVCRVVGNVYGLAAHGTMKTKVLIYPQMLGALSILILIPLAVNIAPGNVGVGVALVVASLLYVTGMHYTIRRHLLVAPRIKSFIPVLYIIPIYLIVSMLSEFHTGGLVYDGFILAISGAFYLAVVYRTYNNAKTSSLFLTKS